MRFKKMWTDELQSEILKWFAKTMMDFTACFQLNKLFSKVAQRLHVS